MRPHRGLRGLLLLGMTLVPLLGPLQQEEKMEKPVPLGAALAGDGVSSYRELVSYDIQRVSRFPSSAGVMWKKNKPSSLQNKSLNFPWQLTEWIDFSR